MTKPRRQCYRYVRTACEPGEIKAGDIFSMDPVDLEDAKGWSRDQLFQAVKDVEVINEGAAAFVAYPLAPVDPAGAKK